MGEITRDELDRALREDIVYNSDKVASSADVTVHGRTLVNLLGKAGSGLYKPSCTGSSSLSFSYEGEYIVATQTVENGGRIFAIHHHKHLLESGKYYILLIEMDSDEPISGGQYGATRLFSSETSLGNDGFRTIIHAYKFNSNSGSHHIDISSDALKPINSTLRYRRIRMYEISKDEVDQLSELTANQICELYPYVDDIKCVVNPYLESKENLLDGYDTWKHAIVDSNGVASLADYENSVNLTGNVVCVNHTMKTLAGEEYTLFMEGIDPNIYQLVIWNFKSGQETVLSEVGRHSVTIKCEKDGILKVAVRTFSGTKEKSSMEFLEELLNSKRCRLILTKGKQAKAYKDCHNSRIMFEAKLYNDEYIRKQNDGTYVMNSIWEEALIDGTHSFVLAQPKNVTPGFTGIYVQSMMLNSGAYTDGTMVRYDGKIFVGHTGGTYKDTEGFHFSGSVRPYILIPNNLTGWGDDYTPTSDEIRAFFLGWRMFISDTSGNLYNGTGTKAWAKLWCGIGEYAQSWVTSQGVKVVSGSGTNTFPVTINDKGYTPYRLIYKKPLPTLEKVKTYGSLLVKEGVDVKVSSGLVLGEVNIPVLYNNRPHLNAFVNGAMTLRYKCDTALKVYQDNRIYPFISGERGISDARAIFGEWWCYVDNRNPWMVDYMIRETDTVTPLNYSINKADNVKELISRSHQDVANCFEELAKTKKELERAKEELSTRSNPNLLMNANFKNVVNQRCKTVYDASREYSIDRWQYHSAIDTGQGNNITVNKNYITLNAGIANNTYLRQVFDNDIKNIATSNDMITVSIKYRSNAKFRVATIFGNCVLDTSNTWTVRSFTINVQDKELIDIIIQNYDGSNYTSGYLDIEWIKMELGAYATPFIPKSYAEELEDCKRYFVSFKYSAQYWLHGYGHIYGSGQGIWLYMPLTINMRTNPTLWGGASTIANWRIIAEGQLISDMTAITVRCAGNNGVLIQFTRPVNVAQNYKPISGYYDSGELGGLDAEIY